MGAFLIVLLLAFIVWPFVSRLMMRLFQWWIRRKLSKAMGMDSDFFKKGQRGASNRKSSGSQKNRERSAASSAEPIIPKEYAVDVEFVEVKEFTHTEVAVDKDGNSKIRKEVRIESQVTDVEWEEVK